MFIVVHVKYDAIDGSSQIKTYERNSLDVFQKIWNTTCIQILKVLLKVYNAHNHLEVIDQYFYIDSRNKI